MSASSAALARLYPIDAVSVSIPILYLFPLFLRFQHSGQGMVGGLGLLFEGLWNHTCLNRRDTSGHLDRLCLPASFPLYPGASIPKVLASAKASLCEDFTDTSLAFPVSWYLKRPKFKSSICSCNVPCYTYFDFADLLRLFHVHFSSTSQCFLIYCFKQLQGVASIIKRRTVRLLPHFRKIKCYSVTRRRFGSQLLELGARIFRIRKFALIKSVTCTQRQPVMQFR